MTGRLIDALRAMAILGCALATLVAAEAAADDAELCQVVLGELGDAPDADAAIETFMNGLDFGCFGGDGCTTALCAAVARFEELVEPDELRRETVVVAGLVQDFAMAVPRDDALAPMHAEFQRWRPLGPLVLEQREAEIPALVGSTDNIWVVSDGKLFRGRPAGSPPAEIDLLAIIDAGCAVPGPACRAGFDLAADAATAVNLQRRIVARLSLPERVELADKARRADARWGAYFRSGRSQLPWELLLNSRLHERDRDALTIDGPPNAQWILLHPSLGATYTANRDDDIQQAIVLELVGYYAWRWGSEDEAEVRRPLGGSLVLSFDGDDDPALGAMIHLPRNWSIGGTIDRDENVSVLLSLDVAKLIQSNDQVRRVLTGGSAF
jgi:hypothetical protein